MKLRHVSILGAVILGTTGLLGCAQANRVVMCPVASVLADTATYPGFRVGAEGDPAAELYNVRVVNVTTDCDWEAEQQTSDSDIELVFHATRTPTGDADTYTVPYFVAVTYAGDILAKQIFTVQFYFQPGAASADFSQEVESILTHVEPGKMPYDYQILVGMQLTEAQLNYVKLMGRYRP